MMREIVVRSEAESDITEAALWYEEREAGLGIDLVAEIRAATERAARSPILYPLIRKEPVVQIWLWIQSMALNLSQSLA